jgi:hypothetical protein
MIKIEFAKRKMSVAILRNNGIIIIYRLLKAIDMLRVDVPPKIGTTFGAIRTREYS